MANVKISELNNAALPLTGTEEVPLVQSGTTRKATVNDLAQYPAAGVPVSTGTAWGTSKTAPAGALVGTTDTQTLTNKTLQAPDITSALTLNGSAGTSGQVLTSAGAGSLPTWSAVPGGGFSTIQIFTTSGTFTIPVGKTIVKVTVVGAGGGGGGESSANGTSGGSSSIQSGTQTITTITATGGTGAGPVNGKGGGPGGTGTNGDINIQGDGGQTGNDARQIPGKGGSSILGGGAEASYAAFGGNFNGVSASGYGGGGSGALSTSINVAGGGGGGGGAAIKYLTGLTPGNTISVTVGSGGAGGINNAIGGTGANGVVVFEY